MRFNILISAFLLSINLIGTVPGLPLDGTSVNVGANDSDGSSASKPLFMSQDLPIFPDKDKDGIKNWLKPALDAYNRGDDEIALQEIERLLESDPKGGEREVALYLKGDIYLKLAADGDTDFLQAALSSYQEANIAYPDSANCARGLWKIGDISSRLGLHYESIASYKRILSKFPNSPYATKAHLGIAQTYQVWKKWKEALAAYSQLNPSDLAPEDKPLAVLGLAETLYFSEDFPHAYVIYNTGLKTYESYFSQQPFVLFHFGDSAFQVGQRDEARAIFLKFYNIFPRDSLTLMVLARLINIFYLEEDGKQIADMNEIIENLYPGPLGTKITAVINAFEELKTQKCFKKSRKNGLESFIVQKCTEGDSKKVKAPHDEIKEIGDMVQSLLQEPPQSTTVQQFVFQEAEQFLWLKLPLLAFEINRRLYPFIEPSPLQRDVLTALNRTAVESVNQAYLNKEELKVVDLYLSSPDIFSGKIIYGPTGFKIASSLVRYGFYAQAVPVLETAINSASLPNMDEALFLYSKSLDETGDTVIAAKKMEYFLKKYPTSPYRSEVLENLGNLFYKTKKYDLAIEKYKLWISLFPTHPDFRKVSLKLASSYELSSRLRDTIMIYSDLLKKEPHSDPYLYLTLGNNYFLLKEYKEAILTYKNALQEKWDRKSADWIRFRIGKCYEATHQKKEQEELFAELAKNSEDPIIKSLALEKISEKQEVKP